MREMGAGKEKKAYSPEVFCPIRSSQDETVDCQTNCAWYVVNPNTPKGVCAVARVSGDLREIRGSIQKQWSQFSKE